MNAPSLPKPVWLLLLIGAFLLLLLPRLAVVDQSVTIDEEKWLVRAANFRYATASGAPGDTYQKEHPGVTVMLAGALASRLTLPGYPEWGAPQLDRVSFIPLLDARGIAPLDALVGARVVVTLLNAVVLLLAFLYVVGMLGLPVALLALALMVFSPFYASLTYLLHPDGLLSPFVLLALLALARFTTGGELRHLPVAGAATGLAWLTKSPAIVLLPTGLLVLALSAWREWRHGRRHKALPEFFLQATAWGGVAVLVFFALWPAMWVAPLQVLRDMTVANLGYAAQGHSCAVFFNGAIFGDGQIPRRLVQFYPLTYLWRSTPLVLLGLPLAFWGFWRGASPFSKPAARFTFAVLLLFVALYVVFMSLGLKKFDRYLLPVYPPLFLVSAGGWIWITQAIRARSRRSSRAGWAWALPVMVVAVQVAALLGVYPYYHSYYNGALGTERAQAVMQVGWGEALDEPARYLNGKPDAAALTVASWYLPSFSYYFDGATADIPCRTTPELEQQLLTADYLVIYAHQWQRGVPAGLLAALAEQQPESVFRWNGIEYARVYAGR